MVILRFEEWIDIEVDVRRRSLSVPYSHVIKPSVAVDART